MNRPLGICLLLGLLLVCPAMLQGKSLLMCINGEEISCSEFLQICERDSSFFPVLRKDIVDRFVDFYLMVEAARQAGIDTLPDVQERVRNYRSRLSKSYLLDGQVVDKVLRTAYNRMVAGHDAGRVQVCHIFKYLPQNASPRMLHAAELRMDSLYEAVLHGASFEECVKRYSDEKRSFWVSRLQMPEEFEDTVFRMQPGQISRPFFTPQGIHIVKVLSREEIPPFPVMKNSLMQKQIGRNKVKEEMSSVVEKLKKEYSYTPDRAGMDDLRRNGHTDRTLFVLDEKPYTGADFAKFAMSHPGLVSTQLEDFVIKSVLDLENVRLERKYPDFSQRMQAYRDSLLAHEIYHREVYEKNACDDARLEAYYEAHRGEYARYEGLVVHAVTKRLAKQVRKFLKRLPEEEWDNAVRLVFNADGKQQVLIEHGTFSVGDNAFIDELVFRKSKAEPLQDYPFTVIQGQKLKSPADYREIRDRLSADYYREVGLRWLDSLRAVSKVEINQEVLKTVNNH